VACWELSVPTAEEIRSRTAISTRFQRDDNNVGCASESKELPSGWEVDQHGIIVRR
jgi:hypothetical protein